MLELLSPMAVSRLEPKNWNHFPFSPKIFPIFYGWIILFAGIFGILISVPGQTTGVSVFTDHLINALGISRTTLSTAYMLGTISSSFALTHAGRLYDIWGARIMAPIAAMVLSLTLVFLSQIDHISTFLARFSPVGYQATVFFVTLFAFAILRFSGQGVLTMVSRNMVLKWFVKKRALVTAIIAVGISMGFSMGSYLLNSMVTNFGWSQAWLITAGIIGVGFICFAVLIFRDNPEACNLLPDGDKGHWPGENKMEGIIHQNGTLAQAQKEYEFWLYTVAIALPALTITAISFNIVGLFAASGFDRETAIQTYVPASFVSAISIVLGSWLSNTSKLKYLLFTLGAAQAMLSIGLIQLDSSIGLNLVIIGMGISQAMFGLLVGLTWPKLFGRAHLGAISGRAMSIGVFASAIGPVLFSLSFEYLGSFKVAEYACLVMAIILFCATFRSRE